MDEKAKNNYREALTCQEVISFVPFGSSMWPTIKENAQSVVVKRKQKRLDKYDVGLYLRNGSNVLHRVMEVKEDGYIMCGDSLFWTEFVKEEDVFGVLDGFYRGKKYVSVEDPEYKKEIEKLYKRKVRRKIRAKTYIFFRKVKRKLKEIFKVK